MPQARPGATQSGRASKASTAAAVGGSMAPHRGRRWRRPPACRRRGVREGSATSQRRGGDVAVTVATAAVDTAAAMPPAGAMRAAARRRVRARVVRAVVHRPTPRRLQAQRQRRQRRWPPPPPAARGCCGNKRDHEDRRAFSADTTPCLKNQNGRLPQGPQSPILANYREIPTSWPFVEESTCPHGMVGEHEPFDRPIAPLSDGFMKSSHHIGSMFRPSYQTDAAPAPGFYWSLLRRSMTMGQPHGSTTRGSCITEGTRTEVRCAPTSSIICLMSEPSKA